ncbi:MAG TPA: hypothetical protein VIJ96_20225 [Acidothermaceae bacterium]
MPTVWIHGGTIPPCPFCGAPDDDQVRRYGGGDVVHWYCLACEQFRDPQAGWDDPLVPISLEDWHALRRVISARMRARWQ